MTKNGTIGIQATALIAASLLVSMPCLARNKIATSTLGGGGSANASLLINMRPPSGVPAQTLSTPPTSRIPVYAPVTRTAKPMTATELQRLNRMKASSPVYASGKGEEVAMWIVLISVIVLIGIPVGIYLAGD